MTKKYPLLPLRDMLIFPQNVTSLFVGREKSIKATKLAMDSNRNIVLITQKKTDTVLPGSDDIFKIGVFCEVLQLLKMPDSTYKVLLEGLYRVERTSLIDRKTHYEVEVKKTESIYPSAKSQEATLLSNTLRVVINQFVQYNTYQNIVNDQFINSLTKKPFGDALDIIAHVMPIPFDTKQDILNSLNILKRAKLLKQILNDQIDLIKLEKNIHGKVRNRVDQAQKHFFLNEQMKVIREELGETDVDEIQEYRKKIEGKKLPPEVKRKAEWELGKMSKMPPISAESTISRNYLDWLLELPWEEISKNTNDLKIAQSQMEKSHYGLKKIKDRILEYAAVIQLSKVPKGPILCFLGPSGVGKTSLARSFASSLNREFARISLGGVRDEAEIRGHRKTYIGALPGRVISALKKAKTRNPIILLDEIDKISSDYRGNPAAALLEVLDSEQNFEFMDHYLELPFDLSQVVFIATANAIHTIPDPLLDRLEIIEVPGYHEGEKINIAKRFLISRQIKENGIQDIDISFTDMSLAYIIRHYTKEAGVRQLEREIAKVCRKLARKILEGIQSKTNQTNKIKITKEKLTEFLGPIRYQYGKKESQSVTGKCNGLAWTSSGGDVLTIEAALSYGKGSINITGNLGDIMKESVNTAVGYIRSQMHLMGMDTDFFEKTDIFVHVPEGAIPKDGPSAGIAITLCLVSVLTQRPVRGDIALTGEITLRGKVLPIGGLREKILAAFRGGIKAIIFPEENKKDLEDIPKSVLSKMDLNFVNNFQEVLDIVFKDSKSIFQKKFHQYPFPGTHLPGWDDSTKKEKTTSSH